MITTAVHPKQNTVIYDGQCRFCRGQIALLRRLDLTRSLAFLSLYDPAVGRDFPELSREALLERMYVIGRDGRARGGAEAVRFLSRWLPCLWPLAVLLHVPGSLPLWNRLYGWIARRRYGIAGRCAHGGSAHEGSADEGCRLPEA